MNDLRPVEADYPLAGPNQTTLVQAIGVPAATLFNCLADGSAWSEWLGIDVGWMSPEPHGVGTTRTITARGQKIDEYFFTWDEGERMGSRFDRTRLPFAAFAEHYECVPIGDDSCELHWSYAYEAKKGPVGAVFKQAFGRVFARDGRRALDKLAVLLEGNPGRFASR